MNHLFSVYIGRFMDIYLDDIVTYLDCLEDHVKHVKLVLDILQKEKLYLSQSKLRFIAQELKLLGQIIDAQGIWMDAEKGEGWFSSELESPNKPGLTQRIHRIGWVPGRWYSQYQNSNGCPEHYHRRHCTLLMGLHGTTSLWGSKNTGMQCLGKPPCSVKLCGGHTTIWMITNGCSTGISGLVSQGEDWKTAKIAAFYSVKLNPAQQNYLVHEIEMLAGVETMLRHIDILQGVKFRWLIDHKGLIYLLNQKNLSGRQAWWLEKISSFMFEVVYIAGSENIVADALSQIYSNDSAGTVGARSEFSYHDVSDSDTTTGDRSSAIEDLPVLAGTEAWPTAFSEGCHGSIKFLAENYIQRICYKGERLFCTQRTLTS